MWWIYALLSAIFAALTAILAKKGIKGVDSDLATAIRTSVILVITWGIVFFKAGQKDIAQLNKMNWLFLILSGVATGLSWLFYFKALSVGKVSQVAPVDKLSIVFAIILSFLFLGEPMTWKVLAGVLLMVMGSILIIL